MVFENFEIVERAWDFYDYRRNFIAELIELNFLEGLNLESPLNSNEYTLDYIKINLFIDKICKDYITPFSRQCFTEAMFSSYLYFKESIELLTSDLYISYMEEHLDSVEVSQTLSNLNILTEFNEKEKKISLSNLMNVEVDTSFRDESLFQCTGIILVNFTKEITKILVKYNINKYIEDKLIEDFYFFNPEE